MSDQKELPEIIELPVVAVRNTVLYPNLSTPINVGRKSIAAIKEVQRNGLICVVAQKDPDIDDPSPEDLFEIATIVRVNRVVQKNRIAVVLQGVARCRIEAFTETEEILRAECHVLDEIEADPVTSKSKVSELHSLAKRFIARTPEIPKDAFFVIESVTNPGTVSDLLAHNLLSRMDVKQAALEILDQEERLEYMINALTQEMESVELMNKIEKSVREGIDKTQKEYMLREQLKAIRKELEQIGADDGEEEDEFDELKRKLTEMDMPEDVRKVCLKELRRMTKMNPQSSEYTVSRTYLDWMVSIPWSEETEDDIDIEKSSEIFDEDHYGLDKVKDRILEYLSVRSLKSDMKGPILCMVGPPGVGKTSLAKSVARATGRELARIALGGVRDEAEIRGHRKTYIGSMPGRIIKGLKKAGTKNPVLVLDEIDKLTKDHRGDPAAALLEVLDPEQNSEFLDHYIDIEYDLSKVLFIATANRADTIPGPLRDRMEMIQIPGYTPEDKLRIAKGFSIPQNIEEHGLDGEDIDFQDDAVRKLIEDYTREAGVRSLKREIAAVCRRIARGVKEREKEGTEKEPWIVTPEKIREIRGPEKYHNEIKQRCAVPGVVCGLAWTAAGGDILFIEATKHHGKGNMKLSGSLGDVMKESVGVATSWVWSILPLLGLEKESLKETDFHVHVPSGAVPKDGPSAGVTMMTAIISLLLDKPVRNDIAMTGEATLRGAVLAVGGIKEKVLAAHRAGIREVIMPAVCEKDTEEIPDEIKEDMQFHYVTRMEEVMLIVFGDKMTKKLQNALKKEIKRRE